MKRDMQSIIVKVMLSLMLAYTLLPVQAFAMENVGDDLDQPSQSEDELNEGEENPQDESTTAEGQTEGEAGESDVDPTDKTEKAENDLTNEVHNSNLDENEKEMDEREENEEETLEEAEKELEDFQLTIMHMNDTHAHLDTMPQMKTAIDEVRTEVDNSLLFHAGDVFSGTLYFTQFNGQADLSLMNLLGFDAMVYGNHEFDLGSGEGGHESLAKFVQEANFPLLGTNLDFSNDPFMNSLVDSTPVVKNPTGGKSYHSIVKNIDGEEVGIFGLTTEDTVAISSPMSVKFLDYYSTAKTAVGEFENAGIDKIIALTHIGYNNPSGGNDLALATIDGIDVIVGGHTHTKLTEPVLVEEKGQDPTVIVQAGQYAENLGRLDVTFDENGVITEHGGELIEVKDLTPNSEVSEALKMFSEKIEELNNTPTGAIAEKELENPRLTDGNGDSVRANETELGNLVTDAMLAKAKEKFPNTVIAVQNGGGIRAAIPAGDITIGDVITVLPFGNDPVVAEVTGAELKEILEHSVSQTPNENGGFLHVAGMKFTYDSRNEPGNRVLTMEVGFEDKFVPIEMNEVYLITTNQFTAQGGDGFTTFADIYADGRVTNIGEIDWEQLMNYMVEEQYLNGVVNPVREGRIIDVARGELPDEEEPGEPGTPKDPEKPGEPGTPKDPEKPGEPGTPEDPEEPRSPEESQIKEVEFGETVEVAANELIELKGTSISIHLPEDLPEGTKITVTEVTDNRPANAAGDIVDVDLQLPEGHEDFQGEFVLTLGINGSNTDDKIAIFYFNEKTAEWEYRGGEISEDNQTISIEVLHFSQYGVLEVEEDQTPVPKGEQGPKGEPGTSGGDSRTGESTKTGGKLPETATSMYTTLFIGSLLLATGLGFLLFRKFKMN